MFIEDLLAHPFTLLISAAIITGILVPYFSTKRENHKKKLEIKSKLISNIDESVAKFILYEGNVPTKDLDLNEKEEWKKTQERGVKLHMIGSELRTYFHKTPVVDEWMNFYYLLISFTSICWYLGFDKSERLEEDISDFDSKPDFTGQVDWEKIRSKKGWEPELRKVNDYVLLKAEELNNSIITTKIRSF